MTAFLYYQLSIKWKMHALLLKLLYLTLLQISNRELLHAVVGLYDVSLGEMTPDTLYSTICERWARTIILLRDVKGKPMV